MSEYFFTVYRQAVLYFSPGPKDECSGTVNSTIFNHLQIPLDNIAFLTIKS